MAKILVAEDDLISREVLVRIAEKMGHCIYQCSNGLRAWTTLEDNRDIKLALLDISMPELTGSELIKRMKAHQEYRNIPIVIISGVIGPKEINELLELGASRFLPKPVNVEELREYINILLK